MRHSRTTHAADSYEERDASASNSLSKYAYCEMRIQLLLASLHAFRMRTHCFNSLPAALDKNVRIPIAPVGDTGKAPQMFNLLYRRFSNVLTHRTWPTMKDTLRRPFGRSTDSKLAIQQITNLPYDLGKPGESELRTCVLGAFASPWRSACFQTGLHRPSGLVNALLWIP